MSNLEKHFEFLWEECEDHFKSDNSSISSVLDEISMKISLYKIIESKTDLNPEEKQKAKSRTMGEILLALTHLSLKDEINTYTALEAALNLRS